jgi:hypothetical protein
MSKNWRGGLKRRAHASRQTTATTPKVRDSALDKQRQGSGILGLRKWRAARETFCARSPAGLPVRAPPEPSPSDSRVCNFASNQPHTQSAAAPQRACRLVCPPSPLAPCQLTPKRPASSCGRDLFFCPRAVPLCALVHVECDNRHCNSSSIALYLHAARAHHARRRDAAARADR